MLKQDRVHARLPQRWISRRLHATHPDDESSQPRHSSSRSVEKRDVTVGPEDAANARESSNVIAHVATLEVEDQLVRSQLLDAREGSVANAQVFAVPGDQVHDVRGQPSKNADGEVEPEWHRDAHPVFGSRRRHAALTASAWRTPRARRCCLPTPRRREGLRDRTRSGYRSVRRWSSCPREPRCARRARGSKPHRRFDAL